MISSKHVLKRKKQLQRKNKSKKNPFAMSEGIFYYALCGMTLTNFVFFIVPSNRARLRLVNFTIPATMAKSVSSLPWRTFFPPWIGVPRWRIKIVPLLTLCPSPTFVPRYFGLESRPKWVEPPAFLCAMCFEHITAKGLSL